MLEIKIGARRRPFFNQRFGRSSIPAGQNIRKSWNIEYIKNAERPHVSTRLYFPRVETSGKLEYFCN